MFETFVPVHRGVLATKDKLTDYQNNNNIANSTNNTNKRDFFAFQENHDEDFYQKNEDDNDEENRQKDDNSNYFQEEGEPQLANEISKPKPKHRKISVMDLLSNDNIFTVPAASSSSSSSSPSNKELNSETIGTSDQSPLIRTSSEYLHFGDSSWKTAIRPPMLLKSIRYKLFSLLKTIMKFIPHKFFTQYD